MRRALMLCMVGELRKNAIGRWEIVNEVGEREELTSGDWIDLWDVHVQGWVATRIESRSAATPPFFSEYYAVNGAALYTGKRARSNRRPRFSPG